MKVKSKGNTVEVQLNNGNVVLISYSTPVAAFVIGEGYFRTDVFYSVTTSRHINKWLEGAKVPTKPQKFFESLLG